MKRFMHTLIQYWGDIVYIAMIPALSYFVYQATIRRYIKVPFARYLFIAYAVVLVAALICIIFLKRRSFRYFMYLAYGALPMMYLCATAFQLFPFAPGSHEIGYIYTMSRFVQIIIGTLSTIRFAIWLHKLYLEKQKAEVLTNISSNSS